MTSVPLIPMPAGSIDTRTGRPSQRVVPTDNPNVVDVQTRVLRPKPEGGQQ